MPRRPAPIAPRMLSAEQAAAYLGYATTGVLANIPVRPRKLAEAGPGSQPKWDKAELDAWLDRLAGLTPDTSSSTGGGSPAANDAENAYAKWKAGRTG